MFGVCAKRSYYYKTSRDPTVARARPAQRVFKGAGDLNGWHHRFTRPPCRCVTVSFHHCLVSPPPRPAVRGGVPRDFLIASCETLPCHLPLAMYKRRARLAFLSSSPELAERVMGIVTACAADWVEACFCPAGAPAVGCDLWVTLDPAALAAYEKPPAGCRHVHWPLSRSSTAAEIISHVDGLVGGMRLLARLDGSTAPGDQRPARA